MKTLITSIIQNKVLQLFKTISIISKLLLQEKDFAVDLFIVSCYLKFTTKTMKPYYNLQSISDYLKYMLMIVKLYRDA